MTGFEVRESSTPTPVGILGFQRGYFFVSRPLTRRLFSRRGAGRRLGAAAGESLVRRKETDLPPFDHAARGDIKNANGNRTETWRLRGGRRLRGLSGHFILLIDADAMC